MTKTISDVHGVRHIAVYAGKNAWHRTTCGAAVRRPQGVRRLRSGRVTCLTCMQVHERIRQDLEMMDRYWQGIERVVYSRVDWARGACRTSNLRAETKIHIEYFYEKTTKPETE